MAPDLPEKLLGIDINDDDRPQQRSDDADDDADEEYIRVVLFTVGDHRLAVPVDDVRTTTDAPEEVTPVPRTPESVEGVTDLRGEITAVIDPSVHFPASDEGAADDDDGDDATSIATLDQDQLLVFDRPGDEQSAAIRVGDISRVASIPEDDVLDSEAAADRDLSTDALEHPLVSALVVQEHHPRRRLGQAAVSPESTDEDAAADPDVETELDFEGASAGSAISSAAGIPSESDAGDAASAPGSESPRAAESVSESDQQSEIVVEVTPVVDIDRLLLAAGPTRRTQ